MPIPGRSAIAVLALVAGGCFYPFGGGSGGDQVSRRKIRATPAQITQAAVAVFQDRSIPVARVDPGEGVVESAVFRVGPYWGGDPVETRVDCRLVQEPSEAADPIEIEIYLRLQALPLPGPPITGRTRANQDSQVGLYSSARVSGAGPHSQCQLAESFVGALLAAVDRLATGGRRIVTSPAES